MALIRCPECGREVSDKAAVCPGCGFAVNSVRKCEECGETLQPGAAICPGCGCPVEDNAAETVQPASAAVQQPAPIPAPAPAPAPQPEPAPKAAGTYYNPKYEYEPLKNYNKELIASESGFIISRLVRGFVDLAVAIIIVIVLINLEASGFWLLFGIVWIVIFIISAIESFVVSNGDYIRLTTEYISGRAYKRTVFNLSFCYPISSIISVTRSSEKFVVVQVYDEKKDVIITFSFENLYKPDEVVDVITSLIASKE